MKTLIIIVLVIIILGLYFAPEITKVVLKKTGAATADIAKKGIKTIADSEEVKEKRQEVGERVSERISGSSSGD